MSLSQIFLAVFLFLFGISQFTRFEYSALILGILAIATAILIFCRK